MLCMKYKCATQEGGWIGNLKIILANPHNKQSNVLIKIESNKFNKGTIIKRVREEKNEHNDFYVVRLSPPTSTPPSSPAWGFHYPSLSKASTITIDFEVSINLYNKRLYLQSLYPKCFPHLYTHKLMRNDKYNNKSLFKSGYTNWRTKMI